MSINSISSTASSSSSSSSTVLEARLKTLQDELAQLEKAGSDDADSKKRRDSLSTQITLLEAQIANASSTSTQTAQSTTAQKTPQGGGAQVAAISQIAEQAIKPETGSVGSKLDVLA